MKKWKITASILWLKWALISLIIVSVTITIISLINGILAIIMSLAPASSATQISFYDAKSFYWLPFNIDDKSTSSVLNKWVLWKAEELKSKKVELNKLLQGKLSSKFWNKYTVNFLTYEFWFSWYNNFINVTTWKENIVPFGITITNNESQKSESIFFYSKVDDRGTFSVISEKVANWFEKWISDKNLWYVSPDGKTNIMFLRHDASVNIDVQFNKYVENLWKGLRNDNKTNEYTKDAYEYLFLKNDIDNVSDYSFFINEHIEWDLTIWTSVKVWENCEIKFSKQDTNLDCINGSANIKITTNVWELIPKDVLTSEYKIKNVKGLSYYEITNKLKYVSKLLIENNNIQFNDSYFIDMANFAWMNDWNSSNQKVLSQQKIDLSVFSWKQFGKDYKNIIINAWTLQTFTLDNAKKVIQSKDQDDTTFEYINGEKNSEQIFKNGGGYSTPNQKYKCIKDRYVIYKNFEELVFGTEVVDDIIPKKCNASPWSAPWLLKKAEIKYYKKFVFRWETKTSSWSENIAWTKYNFDDYRLNYFYHYEKPQILPTTRDDSSISLSNVDYISHVWLDKKSIIWRGIYIKMSSYAWELTSDNEGGFSIKRDNKDGSILFSDIPVKMEIGLLTELDEKDVIFKQNDKGDFEKKEVVDEAVKNFKDKNINRSDSNNMLLSKYYNSSIFDKIWYNEFATNEMLKFDVPAIYGNSKVKKFNNEYVNTLDKQKKFIDILDRMYLWKKWDWTYAFSTEWILKKYISLYSKYPWTSEELNICTQYKPISKIGADNVNENSNYAFFNSNLTAIRQNSLRTTAWLYQKCISSFFQQWKIGWTFGDSELESLAWFLEKNNGLTYDAVMNYPFANTDKDKNDVYYLYDKLATDPKLDWILFPLEKPSSWFGWFVIFYSHYFVWNDGKQDGEDVKKKLRELFYEISQRDDTIIYTPDPIWDLINTLSEKDKSYIEQEYLGYEIVGEPISTSKKKEFLEKSWLTEKIEKNTPFFDLKKAFSFEKDTYDKDRNVSEIYLNPNVYLYSFFSNTKKNNKRYNISIFNEETILHDSPDTDKFLKDKEFFYWYSDHLSEDVLWEMLLQEYRNTYVWLYQLNNSDKLSRFNADKDERLLTKLWYMANSSINKSWFADNWLRNISVYSWSWTMSSDIDKMDYLPITLKVPVNFIKNELDTWNTNGVNNIGRFLLAIKVSNLINRYENLLTVYKTSWDTDKVWRTNVRLDLLRYVFSISSWYYTKDATSDSYGSWYSTNDFRNKTVKEVIEYVHSDYYTRYYGKKAIIDWDEATYDTDIFYNELFAEPMAYILANEDVTKDPYASKDAVLNELDSVQAIRDFSHKYLWRYENPSWKMSYSQFNNEYVDFAVVKKNFEKIISETWSVSWTGASLSWTIMESTWTITSTWVESSWSIVKDFDIWNISDSVWSDTFLKTDKTVERGKWYVVIRDIEALNLHFRDADNFAKDIAGTDIETFVRLLDRNKKCMDYLKEKSPILYYWLYSNPYAFDRYESSSVWYINNTDKLKIFKKLNGDWLLKCNGLSQDEYKMYLTYVSWQITYLKAMKNVLDAKNIQEFDLYPGSNALKASNMSNYVLWDQQVDIQSDIKDTPMYKFMGAIFNHTANKAKDKPQVRYNFVSTTNDDGLPLKLSPTKKYDENDVMNVFYQMFMAQSIANNVTLFDWLKDLASETFNYSLANNKRKTAYMSEFKNMWPFYYLYTNNWYISPTDWLRFEMIPVSSNNWWVSWNWISMIWISWNWDKASINAWLDNLSNTYCEQKSGDVKVKCKLYMEFLKWMSLADYKQEMDWLDMYVWMKMSAWTYPSVWPLVAWNSPFLITQSSARNKVKWVSDNISKRMESTYKDRKFNVYIWQCTWNIHLFKDWDLWGSWKDYYDLAYNNSKKYSTVNYSSYSEEERLKAMEPGDIISMFWWMNWGRCSLSADAVRYWHVAMIVDKDETAKTITVAESNVKSLFITDTRTFKVDSLCDWALIKWAKARYSDSTVSFSNEPIVKDWVSTWTWVVIEQSSVKKDPNAITYNVGINDLIKDNSLTKFVSRDYSFWDLKYIPSIVNVSNSKSLSWKKSWSLQLRKEAWDALEKMSEEFNKTFWVTMDVVSWYRSYDYQVWIKGTLSEPKKTSCSDTLCSFAWRSEHQTWLAVDLFEATSYDEFLSKPNLKKYFDWLNANAYIYWFHNSYQKWPNIDGYEREPWHWRYVWTTLSKELHDGWMSFTEYVKKNAK